MIDLKDQSAQLDVAGAAGCCVEFAAPKVD